MEQLTLDSPSLSNQLASFLAESDDQIITDHQADYNHQDNNTKSCLFCLKSFNNHNNFNDTIPLKNICQNLKIDLEKLVKIKEDVGLCEECASVTSKLSSLFTELERTKMWINHLLRNLIGILIKGEGCSIVSSCKEYIQGGQILKELIMEKCNSTIKTTNFPHLQLKRCQLPDPPIKQEFKEEDADEDELPVSPPFPPDITIKVEETNVRLIAEDDISPEPPSPPPPPLIQNPSSSSSSLQVQQEHFVNHVMKRKPFWFIKPTEEITPQGKRRNKYNCPFCPKLMHGFSACKFHIIGQHPEHIFPFQQLAGLTAQQFSSCCSAILEEEVTPISNEDGNGSYTTFECKYCPIGNMTRKADKRVVQVHLIRCHYNELVAKLKIFQELNGSPEFEQKLGKHLEKPRSFQKKVGSSGEFRRKWRCDECQCGFPNKKRLQVHIMKLHEERVIKNSGEKLGKYFGENEASSTVPKASPCETCGKIFSCGYSLWRHKRLSCLGRGSLVNFEEEQEYVGEDAYTVDQEMLSSELEKDPLS